MKETNCTDLMEPVTSPIPDGQYEGTWGGYHVRFKVDHGREITAKTSVGIRTPSAPCIVTIAGDKATVNVVGASRE